LYVFRHEKCAPAAKPGAVDSLARNGRGIPAFGLPTISRTVHPCFLCEIELEGMRMSKVDINV
jgi:hypothetical protein